MNVKTLKRKTQQLQWYFYLLFSIDSNCQKRSIGKAVKTLLVTLAPAIRDLRFLLICTLRGSR